MKSLDYLNNDDKLLISILVDNYLASIENHSDKVSELMYDQGCCLFVLLNYNDFKENPCHFTLNKINDNLYCFYNLEKRVDFNNFDFLRKLRKAEFISRLSFLMCLYEEGLIFFEDDYGNGISDIDDSNIESDDFYSFKEPIYSKSISDFLDKFYWSKIIPSSYLIKFKRKDFKTPEQRRFFINNLISWIAIGLSLLIGIGSPWLMTEYSKTSLDPNQLETILNAIPTQVDELKINEEQMDSVMTIINKIVQPNNGKVTNEKP